MEDAEVTKEKHTEATPKNYNSSPKQNKTGQILFVLIVLMLVGINIKLTLEVANLGERVDNLFSLATKMRAEEQQYVRVDASSEVAAIRGNPNAPVQIVEFSDFQCVYCAQSVHVLDTLLERYDGQVSIAYRHFPLSRGETSLLAAEAAECAGEQNAFWEMHDLLFENQNSLSSQITLYVQMANKLRLNEEDFKACISKHRYRDKILNDLSFGREIGIRGTPSFYVNGYPVIGYATIDRFSQLIDKPLADDTTEQ
ncbi:MAG: thioredoxin domain-containing protein [Chloroflexi bacterium]|nr:thioredoxin domain-containing protein [Chloroflexota bacterium]